MDRITHRSAPLPMKPVKDSSIKVEKIAFRNASIDLQIDITDSESTYCSSADVYFEYLYTSIVEQDGK